MRSLPRDLVHCSIVAEPIEPGSPVAVGAAGHIVHASEFAVVSVKAKTLGRVVVFDAGVILQEALVEAGVVVFLHPQLCELESAQREDGGLNAVADGALEVVVADLTSGGPVEFLDAVCFRKPFGGTVVQGICWPKGQGQGQRI